MSNLQKAVFLDRDGVLNRTLIKNGKPFPPADLRQMEILPGVAQALSDLKNADFLLIVVTNQPDVARGATQLEKVTAINSALLNALPLDEILVCYHDDIDNCNCRKPKPGLFLQAAEQYGIDLNHSYMVGDRWRDIDAGQAAGCQTILIDYGYQERGPSHPPVKTVYSLPEATEWIIKNSLI